VILESWDAGGICVRPIGSAAVRLTLADLAEAAPAAFDRESGQRLASMAAAEAGAWLTGVTEGPIGWTFHTDSGDALFLRLCDLWDLAVPQPVRPAPQPWQALAPRRFAYDAYCADDEIRRHCLLDIARRGWALLTGVPLREGEVAMVAASFGFVRETNYGRVFDVRSKPAAANLADTPRALEPHTDNPYRDPVPGLQLLHCLEGSAAGGATCLVDGFAIAEALRAKHPDDFAVLARTPVRFGWSDAANRLEAAKPVIEWAPTARSSRCVTMPARFAASRAMPRPAASGAAPSGPSPRWSTHPNTPPASSLRRAIA
jgi:gamma-butyrobetaine dioxygenase